MFPRTKMGIRLFLFSVNWKISLSQYHIHVSRTTRLSFTLNTQYCMKLFHLGKTAPIILSILLYSTRISIPSIGCYLPTINMNRSTIFGMNNLAELLRQSILRERKKRSTAELLYSFHSTNLINPQDTLIRHSVKFGPFQGHLSSKKSSRLSTIPLKG